MTRRVAVIGGGSSGLVCIKSCLEQGLEPVCFESNDDIGGLWKFKATPEPGRSSAYRSLVTNTSKEMMCFSDFPMPAHFPNYMRSSHILHYLRLYAGHFNLLQYIRFKTSVCTVAQTPDFSYSGQWEIVTVDEQGQRQTQIFDAVLVCTGRFTQPVSPEFSGFQTFAGHHCHSWEYKDAEKYKGKKVMVVGIGNSAADIAVEISRVAEKTFLSTRHGAWVVSRLSVRGFPLDVAMITRFTSLLPASLRNWLCEGTLNKKYDHHLYNFLPKHRFLAGEPVVNDDLPGRVLLGEVLMKPNIHEFRGSEVEFEDGTEEEIDAVVFCTGYRSYFPFLPSSIFSGSGHEMALYKSVFPPTLDHPTLAVMGLFYINGPIMTGVELQSRWATRVFAGFNQLPSKEAMIKAIDKTVQGNIKKYSCPSKAALQVDYLPYLDDLAEEIGVKPSIPRLLLCDPRLSLSVLLGPCTPYQYRLCGTGKWAGARQAILTQWERVEQPFKPRAVPNGPRSHVPMILAVSGVALVWAVVRYTDWFSVLLQE